MSDCKELLCGIYLFRTLSSEEIDSIEEITDAKTYGPGDEVFIQGDKAEAFYLINHGSIRITKSSSEGDPINIATLGSGSHFGEMAFIDNEIRSATATCIERSEIISVPYQKLGILLIENLQIGNQFYKALAGFLSGRLRVTTEDLSFAKEKNLRHF